MEYISKVKWDDVVICNYTDEQVDEINRRHKWAQEYCEENENFKFTGWKDNLKQKVEGSNEWFGEGQFVAQWAWFNPDDKCRCIYVNLPGMEHGYYKRWDCYDIGYQRITFDTLPQETDVLIRCGLNLLNRLREKCAVSIRNVNGQHTQGLQESR
jgi:hypothetical protein